MSDKIPTQPVFRFERFAPDEGAVARLGPDELLDRLAELFVRVAIERRA